jgi:hypothetical protein
MSRRFITTAKCPIEKSELGMYSGVFSVQRLCFPKRALGSLQSTETPFCSTL